MLTWFLVYTIVALSQAGGPAAETHYRRYTTKTECQAARDAFNGTDNMFAECFALKTEQPALPKTSL